MTSLEDIVNQLFEEQPALSGDEAITKLREMKDPDTNKARWKTVTIRNRVETYLRRREIEKGVGEDNTQPPTSAPETALPLATAKEIDTEVTTGDMTKEPAVETKGTVPEEPRLAVEGQQLSRKPVDPFSPPITRKELDEKLRSTITEVTTTCANLKKDMVDLVSTLKTDVKNAIIDVVTQLKQDVKQMVGTVPQYESVKYTNIELRQNTADALADYCSNNEKEISDSIDQLIINENEYTTIKEPYQHLEELAKKSTKGTLLRVYSENDKVCFDEQKTGQGIPWKYIALGIGIGIGIGIAIILFINLATGCLCPLPVTLLPDIPVVP